MQCKKCRRDAPAESLFCPNCGARIAESIDTPEVGSAEQAAGLRRAKSAFRKSESQRPEEVDLWHGTYSPKAMVGEALAALGFTILGLIAVPFAWATPIGWAVFGIGLLLVWGLLFLVLAYRRLSVRYRLTTFRLFHESGLLSRTTDRIEAIDIDDVSFSQGPVERMLGVGTIRIMSSDQTDPAMELPGIENVRAVASLVDEVRRQERRKRGLYVESV